MIRSALTVVATFLFAVPSTPAADPPVSRIAFGSCAKQDKPQPIWEAVVGTKPQHFVFLGDNIYADTEDMDVMKAKYALLGKQPGYVKLKAVCPVHATWDDHDYGGNDAGTEYPKKKESQQVFLDFFEVPKDDPRRAREGVYSSTVFGPPGKRVQLILLDARYFRSPLKKGFKPGEPGDGFRGKYTPNTDQDATVLGEAQWKWLAEQLKVPAELRLIGSGVQVVPDEHGSETWGNFPLERKRLFRLIKETGANGVVFLSGDRHLSELSKLPADHADGVGYPLFDVTSSSLNAPSGNFTKSKVRFANEINSYRVGLTYFEVNFGTVLIDWEADDPVVRLQVREEQGDVVLQQRLTLSQLRAKPTDAWVGQKVLARKAGTSLADTGKDGKPVTLPVRHLVYTVVAEDGDRIRVNYPGQEGWAAKAEWVRLSDAMEHFTARIKADPKDAFAWSRRGIANRYAGKPDLALKDLDEAVRLAPRDADLVGIRGMMCWANKKLDEAIADYTEAVKLDPTYAVGFRNRGLAWHAKGEFDKAVADYSESARVAPHYAPAFHDRATTWRAKGEPRKARDDLSEAVRLDARYAAAMADLARLLATCEDDKLRDGKRAVELAAKANELTGGRDPSALDALAAAHAETGDFDKAVEFQKKALADKTFEKDYGAKGRERLKLYEQKKSWRE
jgi:alkaline phosphatase D